MIGWIRDWFARNVLAILYHRPENLLWVDRHGILRDLYGCPIKSASVSKERVRQAWKRRRLEGGARIGVEEIKAGLTD